MIAVNFIRGLKIGIEYTNLDEGDAELFGFEEDAGYTMISSIDLGFFRVIMWS